MLSNENYEKLLAEIKEEFSDFEVVKKSESRLMKSIDAFLKIATLGKMKSFMDSFVTTVGNTVYVPDGWSTRSTASKAITMRHERVHMRQSKSIGRFKFSLLYLLAPVPVVWAYYRTKFEKEGYEESLRAYNEYYGKKFFTLALREHVVNHFVSAEYFWMWPWKKSIEQWYDALVSEITKND